MTGGLWWAFQRPSKSSMPALLGGHFPLLQVPSPLWGTGPRIPSARIAEPARETAAAKDVQQNRWPLRRQVLREVRGYAIRACRLARFQLRKRLLKFIGVKASSICWLEVLRVDRLRHRRSMTTFLESLSLLRPLIFAYSRTNAEAFARSLAYILPFYGKNFPVVWDSLPYK